MKSSEEVKIHNLKALVHGVELATKVIQKVAGEAVSTTVDGKIMNSSQIRNAVTAKMQSVFIKEGVSKS